MSLRKLINFYLPLWDFLYILQLEEYELKRYLSQVPPRLFKRNFEVRDSLKFTPRVKIILALTLIFLLSMALSVFAFLPLSYLIIIVLLAPFVTPYLILIASVLVQAPVALVKKKRMKTARNYFLNYYKQTKIIAITGSFGKTTTKYLLAHVLQYDYKIEIIPDNINTGIGIANHLLDEKIKFDTEILIVEMGAYTQGDITETATILPPDIAIITIFGDQHYERFGSFKNLVRGKCEIFTTNKKTKCYLSEDSLDQIKNFGISIDNLVPVHVPDSQKSTKFLVHKLALDLGVSEESINTSLKSFEPPERRNNMYESDGVLIIDNSYNLSPMVAERLLSEAAKKATKCDKELVVMTGGISEQGSRSKVANNGLGKLLNKYASRVFVNPTVYAADVISTLRIPYETILDNRVIVTNPNKYLKPEKEVLLWLTGHGDNVYF